MDRFTVLVVLSAGVVWGCADDADPVDAGVTSLDASGPLDADTPDAGFPDSGMLPDAGSTPDAGEMTDGGFVPPAYGTWVKFEPEGAVCSDGSPYKFFVNFSRTSTNAVIFFEAGGACWDYASCTGTGIRSAANRNGLRDDHASALANLGGINIGADVIYPLLNPQPSVNPMHDWNKVFLPYCTGDVFSGDRVVTYEDPSGVNPSIEFNHVGHRNVLRTIDVLSEIFPSIGRMFVSGCSAGGTGALTNYYFLRTGLNVDRGYLFDDSGPIFPSTEPTSQSRPLQNRVRASWNTDSLVSSAPESQAVFDDFGQTIRVLADAFPDDRLAHSHFRLDYNYSLYSYERFYQVDDMGMVQIFGDGQGLEGLGLDETVPRDRTAVYDLWGQDTALLRAQFEEKSNLGYFMPFYRDTNSSHCLTIPGLSEFSQEELLGLLINDFETVAWAATDIETSTGTMDVRDYVNHLLDDTAPLESYFEEEPEGRYQSCVRGTAVYSASDCEAAHDD